MATFSIELALCFRNASLSVHTLERVVEEGNAMHVTQVTQTECIYVQQRMTVMLKSANVNAMSQLSSAQLNSTILKIRKCKID